MGLRLNPAASLLLAVLLAHVCEAALLRKSSASDFLRAFRERRATRCSSAECSGEDSEAEELLEANSDYEENSNLVLAGGSQGGLNVGPGGGAADEGSGM